MRCRDSDFSENSWLEIKLLSVAGAVAWVRAANHEWRDVEQGRERVLRISEERHAPLNISLSLPSLDGIKRAVEMGAGVAVLPRRCALTEIERGDLVAVKVPELSERRVVRFVFRKAGELTHAAAAFLHLLRESRPG